MATQLLHLCLLSAVLAGVAASSGNTTAATTVPCPATRYRCGDAVDIRYPFWVDDSRGGATNAPHCGYPNFGLECRGGTPLLSLPSGDYAVTSILYTDFFAARGTINLYDFRVSVNSSCPLVAYLDLPPGSPPPFALTANNRRLTFLIDCSFHGADEVVPCLRNGNNSYVIRDGGFSDGTARECQEVVTMPVLSTLGDVVTALKAGFELSWSPAAGGNCGNCEAAGGLCGVDEEAFRCFSMPSHAPPAAKSSRISAVNVVIAVLVCLVALALVAHLCKWIRKKRLAQEGSRGIQMGSIVAAARQASD